MNMVVSPLLALRKRSTARRRRTTIHIADQDDGPLRCSSDAESASDPLIFDSLLKLQPPAAVVPMESQGHCRQSPLSEKTDPSVRPQVPSTIALQIPHPQLGLVNVRVSGTRSSVAISFVTATAAGRAAIVSQVERLLRPIKQQGLAITRCDVHAAGAGVVAADPPTTGPGGQQSYWA